MTEISLETVNVIVNPVTPAVTVAATGLQGPPGPSSTANVAYIHTQGSPSDTWEITHNLGWNPNVTVVDSAGTNVEGNIEYVSDNSITLTFSAGFSGTAYLS